MGKFAFDVAVAFAPQASEGTFDATLDGITTTLSYTQGLLLGDPESGVHESGLALTLGRRRRDKAPIGSGFGRPLSDFLAAEVPTFTFATPFCGSRNNASTPPVDADAVPILGLRALLEGCGLVGAAWGSGVGHRFVFGSPNPFSALVYVQGMRLELLDCRCALEISFEPGSIPILEATIEVGSVKDQSLAALPTLTYGPQATVTAPKVVAVGNAWQETRGFSEASLIVEPSFEEFGDSNALTGIVKEQADREVRFEATLYADDTVNKGYEYSQLVATSAGTLDPLSFQVGASMTNGNPAEAVQVVIPLPENVEQEVSPIGSKAAYALTLHARANAGNDELEIIFR